mgnify:CR=1 FL=1
MNLARFKPLPGPLAAAILFSFVFPRSEEWGEHTYVRYSATLKVTYHALWWLGVIAFLGTLPPTGRHPQSIAGSLSSECRATQGVQGLDVGSPGEDHEPEPPTIPSRNSARSNEDHTFKPVLDTQLGFNLSDRGAGRGGWSACRFPLLAWHLRAANHGSFGNSGGFSPQRTEPVARGLGTMRQHCHEKRSARSLACVPLTAEVGGAR